MLAIAALGGLFAFFGVTGAVAIIILAGAVVAPILLAGPGRRLGTAAWATSLFPLLLPLSLYATWFTAWAVLGHRPRSSLDDPKSISPIVEVPYAATGLCLMSVMLSWAVSILLMMAHVAESISRRHILPLKVAALLLAPILVWGSVFAFLYLGLLGADHIIEWYMD
jgi:hypothetical protein